MLNSEYREIRLRDGRALAYAEYGNPRGQPIIHCHGTPSSRVEGQLTFNGSVAAELGVRIILPDRPGMGRSDFQPGRRIVDWPNDVLELATALELGNFAVLGASGGAPYAVACGVRIPNRVQSIGLLGGVAPFEAPGILATMNRPLRMTSRLARSAPAVLRVLYRLNLRMINSAGTRGNERMVASFPEPDRSLFQQHPEVADGFIACFVEACRQGTQGPVWDSRLIAGPWGFDLAAMQVPVLLWQGERDRNVHPANGRYLAGAIPNCRAVFYPEEGHLTLPMNHQQEILSALVGAAT